MSVPFAQAVSDMGIAAGFNKKKEVYRMKSVVFTMLSSL